MPDTEKEGFILGIYRSIGEQLKSTVAMLFFIFGFFQLRSPTKVDFYFFAERINVSAENGLIIGSIFVVGGTILFFMPKELNP